MVAARYVEKIHEAEGVCLQEEFVRKGGRTLREKAHVRQDPEEGKPIPTELRNVESTLRRKIDLEDENTARAEDSFPQLYRMNYPHLIFNNISTKVGERTANILKHLFPVPKSDSKRILTFANQSYYISFRHHVYEKHRGPKSIELKAVGPRFELQLFQIKLGTLDQKEAQTEYVIWPYMNTSNKKEKY